jgi:2-dehydro-3-deoxygluconokinase
LHVSGISQAISSSATDAVFEAIVTARAAGALVSYDTNLRLKLWPLARARAITHAAMAMADIALPGYDDAVQLTGLIDPDRILDFYLGLGPRIVALTLGSEGTLVATPSHRQRIPAFPVDAVDATAAGDTFDGAFLAEYLLTNDLFAAVKYANAAAALSTLGYGAVAPIPRRSAVLDFVTSNSGPTLTGGNDG